MRYREPRQPERERGVIVYTTETPFPLSTTSSNGTPVQNVEIQARPRTEPVPTKEETMSRRRSNPLPYGAKMNWVDEAVTELANEGHRSVNAQMVFAQFPAERKKRWLTAYHGKSGGYTAINSALNAIAHSPKNGKEYEAIATTTVSGRYDIQRNQPTRTLTKSEHRRMAVQVAKDAPVMVLDDAEYVRIGTSTGGAVLWMHYETRDVGVMTFKKL